VNTLPVNVSTYLARRVDNAMIWKHAHAKWMHKLHRLYPSEPVTCLSVKNIHIIACRKRKAHYYLCSISVDMKQRVSQPIEVLLLPTPAHDQTEQTGNFFFFKWLSV